ncbi:MAG: hypothetical protein AAGF86_17195 [Pseudomonadota bacterium]
MPGAKILVFGHARPWALSYVLEGLKRQDALARTQVWLDGHQHLPELMPLVEKCRQLEATYPAERWMKYGSRNGFVRLFIDALQNHLETSDEDLIILQDDCFPAPGAIAAFEEGLEKIRNDGSFFSIYGHHFNDPSEEGGTPGFQAWGWATTAEKLRPVFEEFHRLWRLPEPECVAWVAAHMTEEIRAQMDLYPGRANAYLIDERFCFDAMIAFLALRAGQQNLKTQEQVVFNFGMGRNSMHFKQPEPHMFESPFNMTAEEDLVDRFELHHLVEPAKSPWARLRRWMAR